MQLTTGINIFEIVGSFIIQSTENRHRQQNFTILFVVIFTVNVKITQNYIIFTIKLKMCYYVGIYLVERTDLHMFGA